MKKITLHLKIQVLCTFLLFGFSGFSQEIDLTSLDQLEDPANSGKTIKMNRSLDLSGKTITIASGITLKPFGGILKNGEIAGQGYTISTDKINKTFSNTIVFKDIYDKTFFPEWYGAKGDGSTDDSEAILNSLKASEIVEMRRYRTYYLGSPVLLDRPGTIQIEGNNVKITTAGFANKPALRFDNLFSQVTIENLEIDGENSSAGGIWASSSFKGDNLNLINFYNEIDAAYGIHFEIEDKTVNILLQNSNIDNIKAKNNGDIGDGPGTARAVRVYWRTSRPNSNVRIKDNTLTNIVAEDGDVIQIAQNNHQYINPTTTVISGNYIANATRRWVKATASNVKIFGNTFRNFKQNDTINTAPAGQRTYMVAFQIFDAKKVDLSKEGDYVLGALFENNNVLMDSNWDFGNGGVLGLDRTSGAVIQNNTFTNGRIVCKSFNQNALITENKLTNSNFDFVIVKDEFNRDVVSYIFNNFKIIDNEESTMDSRMITRPIKSIIGFAKSSVIEDLLIDDNTYNIYDQVSDASHISFLTIDPGCSVDKLEVLNNNYNKKTVNNQPTIPMFIQSSVNFSEDSRIVNNFLRTERDNTFYGLRFIGNFASYPFEYTGNLTSFGKEMCPNGDCTVSKSLRSTASNTNKNNITIFPIPVTNLLQIKNWDYSNSSYVIIDITGRKVLSGQLTNSEIDTSTLLSGTYTLMLNSDVEQKKTKFIK